MGFARGRVLTLTVALAVVLCAVKVSAHVPNSFEFIEKLGGYRKGEKNVTELYKLKAYLNRFGYACSNDHLNGDEFDDSLEAAIKAYQMNYGLQPTGVLDKETARRMMAPRCAYPDTVNQTVQLASGMKMKKPSSSLHTVSHYSFFPNRLRWPLLKTNLKFTFLPNVPNFARQPIFNAFGQWDAGSRFTFQYVTDLNQADLRIAFYNGDHGDGSPFDGPGGVIAHSFPPTVGSLHFDATEIWSRGPAPGAFHLETVAVHEIGHLLGLGHSQVQEAVMFPTVAAGGYKLLHADDMAGVRALYS